MKSANYPEEMDLDAFLDSLMNPETKPKFPFSLPFSEGVKYLQLHQYEKAISKLDFALKIDPESVKALMKRSKANIGLRKFSEAKEDAMEALKLWPEFSQAFDAKGQSQYLMGDFEGGYLTYQAGSEIRPNIERLRLGQQLCKESIENSMWKKTRVKIDKSDIAILMEPKDEESQFAHKPQKRILTFERFASDKKVFKDLLADRNLKSVHGLCGESLDFIKSTESFWAMQAPLFSRKKLPIPTRRFTKKESVLQYLMTMKSRCQYYLRKGLESLCITESQRVIAALESHPELPLSKSMKLKADILHLLSLAYENEKKDLKSLDHLMEELDVSQTYDLVHPEIRSFHHLAMVFDRKVSTSNACRCFVAIIEGLSSDRLKNFLEERNETVKEGKIGQSSVLRELEAAESWVHSYKSRLIKTIRFSIINPAKEIVQKMKIESNSTSSFSSEGGMNETENSFTEDTL